MGRLARPDTTPDLPVGTLTRVDHPPVVKLPGHPSGAGYLLEWRRTVSGWEAVVEIMDVAPGYRGGLQEPRAVMFGAHEVEKVPGEDYSQVPRTRVEPEPPTP